MKNSLVALVAVLIASCGLFKGAGYSMYDQNYFMETPIVDSQNGSYKLVWKYGEMGFYFIPECKVIDTELVCSLNGTSSSGNLTGQYGELPLNEREQIEAIKSRKLYWLEPSGKKIELSVNPNA